MARRSPPAVALLQDCFDAPSRLAWSQRPDVYALVVDGGETQRVTNRQTKVEWDLLKMTVTDQSHAGCVVNFWCDKARKAQRLGARPGDIVRLLRIMEPKKPQQQQQQGPKAAVTTMGATTGAAAAAATAAAADAARKSSRFPRQLSAWDVAIVWRSGVFAAGEEPLDHPSERVISWARATWPGLCMPTYPTAAVAASSASHQNDKQPNQPLVASELIVPKFYSLRDLLDVGSGGGGGGDGAPLTSSSSQPLPSTCSFQGACLLRCRVKRLYLPPKATDLCAALQAATASEHRGIDDDNEDDSKKEETEETEEEEEKGEDAESRVCRFLHQLVVQQPAAAAAAPAAVRHYHGWYVTVADCDEEQLEQMGTKDVADEELEHHYYQEAVSEYSTQEFLDDILGAEEDDSGYGKNDDGEPSRKRARAQHQHQHQNQEEEEEEEEEEQKQTQQEVEVQAACQL